MPCNSNISQQDSGQIVRKIFDCDHDSIRVVFGNTTEMAMDISAADGDSVTSYNRSLAKKASLSPGSSGVVIAEFDMSGMKEFAMHCKTTSALTGPQSLTLEVSPHDSDDIWLPTSLTLSPSDASGAVVSGPSLRDVIGRRARVSLAAPLASGSCDLYLVGQGS